MKTVIITGASGGIGQAVSQVFLNRSYQVLGIGRDFSACAVNSPHFIPIIYDLTNTLGLEALVKTLKSYGDIHCLVNNAGVGYYGLHETLNSRKLHEMVAVNLEAPLILSQLLLRDLKRVQGYIINISSVTALHSSPHGCAYGATKAGLTSFGQSLFDEARKYGLKVVTIHPDMTRSRFYRNADFMEGETEDTFLNPQEVAGAVEMALDAREGLVLREITLQPQKHQLRKKGLPH